AVAANFVASDVEWNRVNGGFPVELGPLRIDPFAVPHDAAEPVQFAFTDGNRRAALLTDAGESSATIVAALSGLHALMLECNHDSALLRSGSYPLFLKARIAGGRGHLSNAKAAEILTCLDRRRLQWVAAAHLSRANNRPELAHASLAAVLGTSDAVAVVDQGDGLDWRGGTRRCWPAIVRTRDSADPNTKGRGCRPFVFSEYDYFLTA